MAGRSRSDSGSSSSSSSSGSSVEAQTAAVSTAKLPASRNLSNIGYRPPRGFEPVSFSSTSPYAQKKLAGASKEQQVWTVRIPAGLSPAQLDGTVIDVPRDTKDASKPLGSIQVATSSVVDTYSLYASASSAAKGKGKSVGSSADSQLIVMASDKAADQAVAAGVAVGQGAATELECLRLLVPAGDGSEPGKLVVAPVRVARCLHLSIVSPAETTQAQKPTESANTFEQDKLPKQPWHLLKGNFKPAGSRGPTTTSAQSELAADSGDKTDKKRKVKTEAASDKEDKKSKKAKK